MIKMPVYINNKKIQVVILLFLLSALPLILFLGQRIQNLFTKATETTYGRILINPGGENQQVGQLFTMTIILRGKVDASDLVLGYDSNKMRIEVVPQTVTGLALHRNLNYQNRENSLIVLSHLRSNDNTQADLGNGKPIALLNITPLVQGPAAIILKPQTVVAENGANVTGVIIPAEGTAIGSYTFQPAPTATPTSTPMPTASPTPTHIPTSTPTVTAIPSLVPTVTPTATTPTISPTLTGFPTNTPAATPQPTATIVPGTADYTLAGPTGTINTNTNFNVIVNINTGNTSVKEAQATLSYDPAKVWWVSTIKGTFLPALAPPNTNTSQGWALGKLTKGAGAGPSGTGSLLIFTFKAVCQSTSTIQLKANPTGGQLINYVFKDITSNVNIYNGGTDSITINAAGAGTCGLPITPTPTRILTPTPTPSVIQTPTPTPEAGIVNFSVGVNRVKIFNFVTQFFAQRFNRNDCPALSYKNNLWKANVVDFYVNPAITPELANSSIFSFINCKRPITITSP